MSHLEAYMEALRRLTEERDALRLQLDQTVADAIALNQRNNDLVRTNATLALRASMLREDLDAWEDRDSDSPPPERVQMVRLVRGLATMKAERDAAVAALQRIRQLVDEQADDEGLWGIALNGTQPITEAYLQQELRRLHAAVESESVAILEATT